MVGKWTPKSSRGNEDSPPHRFNGSWNGSFNNSSSNFTSPRKFGSQTKSNKSGTDASFLDIPRFQLFDTKVEIEYIDDDDMATRAYADRHSIKDEPKGALKPRTSGYDFDTLLKDKVDDCGPLNWKK